jgi:hypothetical protein
LTAVRRLLHHREPEASGPWPTGARGITQIGPDFDTLPFNPNSGRVTGGYVTLHITAAGAPIGTWDLKFQTTVGGKAHASGPDGANECDGVGIDDLLVCLGIEE